MNKKNILRVADAIEKGELVKRGIGFNMLYIGALASGRGQLDGPAPDRVDGCKTVGCIAGWCYAIEHSDIKSRDFRAASRHLNVWTEASRYLDLTYDEAEELFQPRHIATSRWKDITPAHAVAVLRHLAETGEVDWSVKP